MAEHSGSNNIHTRRIADFVSQLRYEQIPGDVRERIKLLILDALGCGIYGAHKGEGSPSHLRRNCALISLEHALTSTRQLAVLRAGVLAAVLIVLAAVPEAAQACPTRPVTIVVPFAAGGGNDIMARLIGQHMSRGLGQQFVIENRAGAAGTIGARGRQWGALVRKLGLSATRERVRAKGEKPR